jgi:uncharacterized protein
VSKFLPRQEPIDSFGNGGFRFGGMSHLGAILSVPSGMRVWLPNDADRLEPADFEAVVAERGQIDHFLLGTGKSLVRPSQTVMEAMRAAQVNIDVMDTGAAIHVYNWVLGEGRRVAAALIAVDKPSER